MSPNDAVSPTSSPDSTGSVASSFLPTPLHPYTSRNNSLIQPPSPTFFSSSIPSPPLSGKDGLDTFHQNPAAPLAILTALPEMIISNPSPISAQPRSTTQSPKRSATLGGDRAPPPPPLSLRRSSHAGSPSSKSHTRISLRPHSAGRVPSTPQRNGFTRGGLNISNMEGPSKSEDKGPLDEEGDDLPDLPELIQTPRRSSIFVQQDSPFSAAWHGNNSANGGFSPFNPSPVGHRRKSSDLQAPLSPSAPHGFEPTPEHGIHARNMSIFFPRPDQAPSDRRMSAAAPEGEVKHAGHVPRERNVFGGTGDWSFGISPRSSVSQADNAIPLDPDTADQPKGKRRGHHHRHSLSHNFFSFMDPTKTDPMLSSSNGVSEHRPSDAPQRVPMLASAPGISESALSPLPLSRHSAQRQMLASFTVLESLIGAGLWVEGQMSGYKCLSGLGYLVVFDAMGVGVMMLSLREGWSTIRRPYGSARFLSLIYFVQSLFLLFAAVYIAKEAIEQVVLGSGGHDHGAGGSHGSHSHSGHSADGGGRPFPRFLLLAGFLISSFSGGAIGNHAKLIEAVGPLFLSPKIANSRLAEMCSGLVNPFSFTIAGMNLVVFACTYIVPRSSLGTLDSALSLVLTIMVAALSYPPTLAFGHVLLQTAPPAFDPQMKRLKRALKEIDGDPRVLEVDTLRCWSIGATTAHEEPSSTTKWRPATPNPSVPSSPRTPQFGDSPAISLPARASFNKGDPSAMAPLVVSLLVHVLPQTSDREILEVTKYAWVKINGAVGTQRHGMSLGETSIGVKREYQGVVKG